MITTQTLKNAARAIEHDIWTDPSTQANYLVKDGAILRRWEPLEDDRDAYQLAAQLFDFIEFEFVEWPDESIGAVRYSVDYAATRKKIVEAAAEIGAAL